MNNWCGAGRLTADPDVRVTQDQKTIARFTMAINRNKKDTDFIRCVAFDRNAELVDKYFRKGDRIGVVGSIRTGSFTNKEGQKVNTTEIAVNIIEFLKDRKVDEFGIPEDVKQEELPF